MANDDYDMDGYIKKYGTDKPSHPNGHYTDEFKRPSHITFSDQSIYHSKETPGGQWRRMNDAGEEVDETDETGRWHYKPSDYVVKQQGAEKLRRYFKDQEPDSVLDLPEEKSKFDKYHDRMTAGPGE